MYKHTQIAWPVFTLGSIAIIILLYYAIHYYYWWPILVSLFVLTICVILFSSLTIIVDNDLLRIRFTGGLIRREFKLKDIVSCKSVKNPWWYGFGIRKIPKGWLFNIYGTKAIEISMKDGRVYRIGTDEPDELKELITRKLSGE